MPELTPDRLAWGLTYYVVLLFSLSVHESAHGWMALRMGDDTAARQGRVTLNPLAHIDPVGTLLVPMLQLFLWRSMPMFGWAKPTPVGAHNFKRLSRGHVLVAGAGPLSNLLLAVLFTAALFVVRRSALRDMEPVMGLLNTGVWINVLLAFFNMVPLPPLDGSWVASWGLPRSFSAAYDRIVQPYGQWILLALFATGILSRALAPLVNPFSNFLYKLTY